MRHNVAGRLFGRTANQRKALLRGLVASLIEHQRIETTVAKAKETRKIAEKLVTLGKRGDLHAKRLAMAKIPNRALVVKLFDEIAPRFADRNGGYLRIVPTRQRVNDRAKLAVLEFVDFEEIRDQATKGTKKEKTEKKAAPAKKKVEKAAAPAKEKAEKKAAKKKAAPAKKKAEKEASEGKEKSEKKAPKKAASAKKKAAKKTTTAKKKTAKKAASSKKK